MRGSNLHAQYFSDIFREDMLNISSGRSRRQSMALADHYESRGGSVDKNQNEGLGLMGNLFQAAESQIAD